MILLVAGTRPEIIKLASVYRALRQARQDVRWCWTGQQPEIGRETFQSFQMEPEHDLVLHRETGSLPELHARLGAALFAAFEVLRPEQVVVQGDTLSAAIAAQMAFLGGIPLAHVEAGLRSWNVHSPFPEEAARVWIDSVADVKFAPTMGAAMTLSGEVYVTGNTGVDAVGLVRPARLRKGRYAVVTMHRRENAQAVGGVCDAIRELLGARHFDLVVWPVHPNPIVADVVPEALKGVPGVELVKPLPYDQMVNLVRHAEVLFTDSGGLQEEALALHTPCVVMRDTTERPEGIQNGGAVLAGTDPTKLVGWGTWLMTNPDERMRMQKAKNPYGDGRAGARIARVLAAKMTGKRIDRRRVVWTGP